MITATKPRILIVDDAAPEREAISRLLELQSFEVVSDADVGHAKEHIRDPFDLVISDLRMGRESGVDLLRYWKQHRPKTPFLLLTGHADVDTAVEAMQLGAVDFLTKPIDPRKLVSRIHKYLHSTSDETAESNGKPQPAAETGLIARSEVSQQLMAQIERAARSTVPVLINGEDGVGKRAVARVIHQQSELPELPLVKWPAGDDRVALDDHMPSAWDGRGCLLVEDVAELGDAEQVALQKELRRFEDDNISNARVIATNNVNLERKVRDGQFRNDLYHRLSVLSIRVAPLRDRRQDIPALAAKMLENACAKHGRQIPEIDPRLAETLRNYHWPGNIRQLKNTVEHLVVMDHDGTLSTDDLPEAIRDQQNRVPGFTLPRDVKLHDLEEAAIKQTLERCNGNRTHAAKSLGISVRTLQRRLKSWGIN